LIEPQGSHSIVVGKLLGKQMKIVTSKVFDLNSKGNMKVKIDGNYFIFDKNSEKRIY